VGSVADVSKVCATSMFLVEVNRINECTCVYRFHSVILIRAALGNISLSKVSVGPGRAPAPHTSFLCHLDKIYVCMNIYSHSSFRPWRLRHHVPSKRRQHCSHSHNAKTQQQNYNEQWTTAKTWRQQCKPSVRSTHLIIFHLISVVIVYEATNYALILWFSGLLQLMDGKF
jgi:hypothetical protein